MPRILGSIGNHPLGQETGTKAGQFTPGRLFIIPRPHGDRGLVPGH